MSEEINAIRNAIELNRQDTVDSILSHLGINEINEQTFQELLDIVSHQDIVRFKYIKALESQETVEHFLKDKLI